MNYLKSTWETLKKGALAYTILAAIGAAVFMIASPHIKSFIVTTVLEEIEAKKPNKQGFREAFGNKVDVPSDEVLPLFVDWYFETQEHEKLVDAIYPLLKEELETIQPRIIIFGNGRAK